MATFVGRADELQTLRHRWEQARGGRPQTVLIEGPAGVGKTALLRRFVAQLDDGDVLEASGDEDESRLPLGLVQQVVGPMQGQGDQLDPFDAGGRLLQVLGSRSDDSTLALVVDDVHLADPASATALTFALRRLRADRVLTILTARSEELWRLPPGLGRLVDVHEGRIVLDGLGDDDIRVLAHRERGTELDRLQAARVRRHTSGNPLHLIALLRERGPDLTLRDRLPAPRSFANLVLASLRHRSPEARDLVHAATVLPDGTALDLVSAVAGIPAGAALTEALEELAEHQLLSWRHDADRWTVHFHHPLVRAAVADALGPAALARLHARAADCTTGEVSLSHRVAACLGTDAALADEVEAVAMTRHATSQPQVAADLMVKAARLSPSPATAGERLQQAVNLLLIGGDLASAKSLATDLEATAPSAQRFYLQAKLAWFVGNPAQAEELATAAWERADELDVDRRGALAAVLAQLCNMRADGAAAAQWAREALAAGLPPDLTDSTEAALALGLTVAGHLDDALAGLATVVPDAAGTAQHRLTARGALALATGDVTTARRDLSAVCDGVGGELRPHRLVAMGVLADLEHRAGSWDASLALAEQAVSLAQDSEQVWVQGYLHCVAVLTLAARGSWPEAESHLAEALRLATELAEPVTYAVAVDAAIHLAACRGDSAAVAELAAPLLAFGGPTLEPGLLEWPVRYAAALTDLGRLDEADEAIDAFEEVAEARSSRARLAALARVRGEVATARRDHQAARDRFEEALALGDGATALEQALARASYGRFLRRRGERRAAVHQLEEAHARLADLGARPFVERCETELAGCGATSRRGTADRAQDLTPQERLVVEMACRGLTNAQIAQQLVLSVKTIGYHLNNAYAKLDVHSRAQLAAVWQPRGADRSAVGAGPPAAEEPTASRRAFHGDR